METESLYRLYRKSAGITTDSRTIKKGEIFFALKGPSHDGNRHALAAIEAGAMAAIVDDKSIVGEGIVTVENVLDAMTSLASFHRRTLKIPVIAVTGTNGKTTTKELVTAVLSRKGRVHSTSGNLNNHIGVPLTLLSAPDDVSFLVVEMGANHMGEIAALCNTAMPTHGIITNIGTAHIEGFGSFENVKKAKSELYQWLGLNGGTVIYNEDNPLLREMAISLDSSVPYSTPGRHCLKVKNDGGSGMLLRVTASIDGELHRFETGLFGSYNIDNVKAAMATGLLFEVPADRIIEAIASYCPANNRSQVTGTGRNTVIRDAYNANPSSMEKALASFAALKAEKKMVILGDMLELGNESGPGHSAIIRQLMDWPGIRMVFVGSLFREAAGNLREEHFSSPVAFAGSKAEFLTAAEDTAGFQAQFFPTSEAAADWLRSEKPEGFVILVKGSRGMTLEKVFPLL
jgi:UDP-N-acetylmuramoyl-tripeptide--D-alanyl-D-alanine ligase